MWNDRLSVPRNNLRRVVFYAEHDHNGMLILPNIKQDELSAEGHFPTDEPMFVPPNKVHVEGLNAIILESPISIGPFLSRLIDYKHEPGRQTVVQPVYDIETIEGVAQEWLNRFPRPHDYFTYAEQLITDMGFSRMKT